MICLIFLNNLRARGKTGVFEENNDQSCHMAKDFINYIILKKIMVKKWSNRITFLVWVRIMWESLVLISKEGLFILWSLLLNNLLGTLNKNNKYALLSWEIHLINNVSISDFLALLHWINRINTPGSFNSYSKWISLIGLIFLIATLNK